MRKVVLISVFVFAATMLFSQSKYLVYKEMTRTGYTSFIHVLAGEKLALTYSDFKILKDNPFLDCDMVSRKPAGYKMLHVVDGKEEIYVADVTMPKFNKISKKSIADSYTLDSALVAFFKKLAVENNDPDTVSLDEPVIMKFTPNIGTERIGDYECTIGTMRVSESYSWKIWYTKAMTYNWAFHNDVFWLVPGTVVRAEDSGGMVYSLESVSDSELVVANNTESVKAALRLFLGR